MPIYRLGYLEQMDNIIPSCRFQNLIPLDCKKPSKLEMFKIFFIMEGSPNYLINIEWIKIILNWDLFTHLDSKKFNLETSTKEKLFLSSQWKEYMEITNSWISFYEWKRKGEMMVIKMADA